MKIYKSYIGRQLLVMAIIPAIVIGIAITYMSTRVVYNVKLDDTKDFLKSSIAALEFNYDFSSFSDSEFYEDENGIVYFRGEKVSDEYEIVDMSKDFTGAEVSLFYENKRIATTIKREDGSRFTRTTADEVWNNYCIKGESYFDTEVIINDEEYFGYYVPIVSDEGMAVGMFFAGLPSATVHNTIHKMNQSAVMICAFLCFVVVVIAVFQTNKVLRILNSVLGYLSDINNENFRHELPDHIVNRNDEFGRIGRQLVELNDSLRISVENDMLTGLYNRRVAMKKLNKCVVWANGENNETFTFAICDIDHLLRLFNKLTLDKMAFVTNCYVPEPDFDIVSFQVMGEIINHLNSLGSSMNLDITKDPPDFEKKIMFNHLARIQADNLRVASYKIQELDDYLSSFEGNDTADYLCSIFKKLYSESLIQYPDNPIMQFQYILESCHLPHIDKRQLQIVETNSYVMIAKYFETCDIFEEPTDDSQKK